MDEGQVVAPATVPWGRAGDAAGSAGEVTAVSGPPRAAKHRAPEPVEDTGQAEEHGRPAAPGQHARVGQPAEGEAEPHVRVDARKLEAALIELRDAVVRVPLLLDCAGIEAARAERQQLLNQIDDYLLPRLRQSGAPILISMVGSTGAGKSTLLNSIVGKQVSATGIRRPTTNSPVLACHPDEVNWFAENVFLPTLPRVRQQGLAMPGRDGLLVLATSEGMPPGVALLDTPDIDSVVAAHRQFASQFLDASDLWLFVTTARRYADAVVWEMLKDARDRGASLGIVLSRVPPSSDKQLTAHFEAMLEANGLGDVQRFVIPETTVTDAQLPEEVSAPVRRWLEDTSHQDERRIAILTQTMSGVLDNFRDRIDALAGRAQEQIALQGELRSAADAAYAAGLAELDEAIRNGSLLRGEVLARWQDFAGTGDLLRTLQPRKGSKGKRPAERSKRHAAMPVRAQALKSALRSSLEALATSLADRAAEDAMERWQASPAGTGLLDEARQAQRSPEGTELSYQSLRKWEGELEWGFPGDQSDLASRLPEGGVDALVRSSGGFAGRAGQAIAAWQDHLLHLVQTENVTRRSIARVASFDPESLALVLTIGALGYGAGDVEVSEGASAVPQRLLTSLFGAGLMRDIGGQARQNLHERIAALFTEEAQRFTALIDAVGASDENAPADLYHASDSLESVR
ncbi:MAG TPA: GTPase [Streptosporangiaceae bacterium]